MSLGVGSQSYTKMREFLRKSFAADLRGERGLNKGKNQRNQRLSVANFPRFFTQLGITQKILILTKAQTIALE